MSSVTPRSDEEEELEPHERSASGPRNRHLRRLLAVLGFRSGSSDLHFELMSLADRLRSLSDQANDRRVDIERYITQSMREVERARMALHRDGVVSFWRHFAEAKKLELVAIERLYHESGVDELALNLLDRRAQDALLQAADVLDTRQRVKVENGLAQKEPRERYYRNIVSAIHTIHQQHISDHLEGRRGRLLESQLQFFMAVIAVCLLLLFYVWMEFFQGFGIAGPTTDPISIEFVFTVVLFGAIGAAVSSLTNLSKVLQRSKVPEQVGSIRLAVARVVLGATSALIVYVFAFTEIVSIVEPSVSSLLAFAFVAGFSERLLVRTVETVTGERSHQAGRFYPEDWFEDDWATRRPDHDDTAEGQAPRS